MIPTEISLLLDDWRAAVIAAQPVEAAPALQIASLVGQGRAVLTSIEAGLAASGAPLDASDPTGHPSSLAAALLGLDEAANDTSALSDVRGYAGRAVLNLSQAG